MKKTQKKPVFRSNNQNQQMLLPPSLEEIIDRNHPVRLINKIIDDLNIDVLYKLYEGNGAPAYDPRTMLKILFYAYTSNIYSSRKIEAAVKENVTFMWLASMQRPDHNTINSFRSNRLKDVLKDIFSELVLELNRQGQLSIKDIYTDGTKIEANANRYTFVWANSIRNRKEKILERLEELWNYADQVTNGEMIEACPTEAEELTAEKVSKMIDNLNNKLKDLKIDKKIKKQIAYGKKNYPEQLERYAKQEEDLGGRNSCSKTDNDATFMRMKDDHLKKGQVKAAYNVQISTNNQYVVDYTVHQTAGDTTTLIDHILNHEFYYGELPEQVTADAGYGSEENYVFAEKNNIEAFIKYNTFYRESKRKWKEDIYRSENLEYNPDTDSFSCPIGKPMVKIETYEKITKTGFKQEISVYRAQNCEGCPLREECYEGAGNRRIYVNHNVRRLRKKAKEKLNSPEGLAKRSRRPIEPESVFGNIKQNKNFKRFMLRGIEKVTIEVGLLSIAHNLGKFSRAAA